MLGLLSEPSLDIPRVVRVSRGNPLKMLTYPRDGELTREELSKLDALLDEPAESAAQSDEDRADQEPIEPPASDGAIDESPQFLAHAARNVALGVDKVLGDLIERVIGVEPGSSLFELLAVRELKSESGSTNGSQAP